jgi:hypothetical protein
VPNGLLNVLDGRQLASVGGIHGIFDLGFEPLDEPMSGGVSASDSCGDARKIVERICGGWLPAR